MAFPLAMVVKIVPFLGLLPAWTAAVLVLFSTTRAEELLEKAGPIGTIASKALAAKTQGGLSLAHTQKSERERVDETVKKEGGTAGAQNRLNLSGASATGRGDQTGGPQERLRQARSSEMPMESANKAGTGTLAGETQPKPQPRRSPGDIGAQPIFRQAPSSTEAE